MKIKKIFAVTMPILVGAATPASMLTSCHKTTKSVVKNEKVSNEPGPDDIEFSTDYLNDFEKNLNTLDDEEVNMTLGETRSAYCNRDDNNLQKVYSDNTSIGYGGGEGNFYCPELRDNTIHFSTNEKSQNFRFISQKFSIEVQIPANCSDFVYNVTLQNHFHAWYNVDFFYGTQMCVSAQLFDLDSVDDQPSFYTNLRYGSEKDERSVAQHYISFDNENFSNRNEYDENFEFTTQFTASNNSADPIKYIKYYTLATMVDGESWKLGRTKYDLDSKISVHLNSMSASQAGIESNFITKSLDNATKDILSEKNMTQSKLAKIYDSQLDELKKIKNEDLSNINDIEIRNLLQQIQSNCNIKFNSGDEFATYYLNHKDEYASLVNAAINNQKETCLEFRKHKPTGWQRYSYFINNAINLRGFSANKYDEEKIAFTSLKTPNEADDSAKGFNGTMSGKGLSFVLNADYTRESKIIYLPVKLEITSPAKINSLSNIVTGWSINFKSNENPDSFKNYTSNKYAFQIFDFGDDEKAVPEFINVASNSRELSKEVDKHCVYSGTTFSGEKTLVYDPLKEDPDNKKAYLCSCLNEKSDTETKKYRYYGIAVSASWFLDDFTTKNFTVEFTPTAIDTNISTSNIYHKGYSSSENYNGETIPMSQLNGDLNDGGYTVSGGVEGNLYEGKDFETNLRAFYSRTRLTTILPPHTQACYNVNLSVKSELQRNSGITVWDILSGNNVSVFDLNSKDTPDPDFIPNYGYSIDVKKIEQAEKNHLIFSKNKQIYKERDWKQILIISGIIALIIFDIAIFKFLPGLAKHITTWLFANGFQIYVGMTASVEFALKILLPSIPLCLTCWFVGSEVLEKKFWNKKYLYYQDISNIADASAKYENIFEKSIVLKNNTDEVKTLTYDLGISFVNKAQRSQEIGTKPFFLTKFDINLMYYEPCIDTAEQPTDPKVNP